jgi:hypothetical protein
MIISTRNGPGAALVTAMAASLWACGGSSGGTDPGSGTQTLLVNGSMSNEGEGRSTELRVEVRRGGASVVDATVTVKSDLGTVALVYDSAENEYRGVQVGYAAYYAVFVEAGADSLDGSITAPDALALTRPAPATAIDARAVPNGVLRLEWTGEAADSVRVHSKDFEYSGPDLGGVDMPASMLEEESQEIDVRRANSVALAGGVPGSELRASHQVKSTLIVVNPF